MIDRILEFSLRHRGFILLACVGLIVIGLWSAFKLPIDAVPDITNVQVQINTSVHSLAPEEIEKLVTFPIEMEMGGIENLLEVRSLSKFGLSQVTLIFKDRTNIYRARQLVAERLQNVLDDLPLGLNPKLAPITTGLGEIYYYAVHFKNDATNIPTDPIEQLRELKLVQDYIVKPSLRTVPGVTEVNTSGGYDKQFVIQPDPAKLQSIGITFAELYDLISENVANAGGSVVEKGGENITIRAVGRVESLADIENIPLRFNAGGNSALRVKNVAHVGIGSGVRTGTATHDGKETVLGAALMLLGENSRIVSERVHERIQEIQKKLPSNMEIETLYNRTNLVNATINTVKKNLIEGAILVIVILLLLLGNIRAALIVATAIPLSMLFAITGMVQTRVSGNLMSLGAVDFGLIVDGAVVIAENIVRLLAEKQRHLGRLLTKEERLHTILIASKQVGMPTVFGVSIITIVYLPMLTLVGVEGKMFTPMAMTVIFALIGALILALTLIPVLCSYFMVKKVSEKDNFLIHATKQIYALLLEFALRSRRTVLIGAIAIFMLSLWVFTRLGAEFIPQLDEGSLAVQMIRTTSIGLDASIKMQTAAEQLLIEKFPEVTHTFARIGTAEVATDPMGVNVGDSYIMLKPPNKWRKLHGKILNKEQLTNAMTQELNAHFPGQSYLFSQPIELRFNELLSGSRADIIIKIFGEDYNHLEEIATEVREIVEKIPGAADVEFDAIGKSPVFQVTANREGMAKYNAQAGEINRTIEAAFAGKEVGTIVDGNRRYPVVIRMPEKDRRNFDHVSELGIRTKDGGLIRLGQVADAGVTESIGTISRESFQRRMALMINLRGRDVQSFVNEAEQKIAKNIKLPEGYYIEFGGQFKNLKEAQARLSIVVPAALALIFLLIFIALRSFRQAAIVYTGIPLAVTGGIFSLWLRDLPFSMSAGIGFIALSGVAVLNGVMMISFFNQLREEGKSVANAVREGALTRLRPVLMTALVASLGFVPMALAQGAGAEVQKPLATVVIGGIITATFLTLLLLPTLYEWIEGNAERRHHNQAYKGYNRFFI